MEKMVISASVRHRELIHQIIEQFQQLGIAAVFPNLDSELSKDDLTLEVMKRIESEHFAAIDSAQAMYVLNPDKIGLLVAAEMGYAVKAGVPIYLSNETDDLGLQALTTGYIPREKLDRFREL